MNDITVNSQRRLTLLTKTPQEFCIAYLACQEGKAFANQFKTMAEVWDACPRADWLFWIFDRIDPYPLPEVEARIRLFMCWAATQTPAGVRPLFQHLLPTDTACKNSVKTALRYIRGEALAADLIRANWEADAEITAFRSTFWFGRGIPNESWSRLEAMRAACFCTVCDRLARYAMVCCTAAVDACPPNQGVNEVRAAHVKRFRLLFPDPFRAHAPAKIDLDAFLSETELH